MLQFNLQNPKLVQLKDVLVHDLTRLCIAMPDLSLHDSIDTRLGPIDSPLHEARLRLSIVLDMIVNLLQSPRAILRAPFRQVHQIQAFKFVHKHKVVERVPLKGDISLSDLAKIINVDTDRTVRILRTLIDLRVFQEIRPGSIAHTLVSRKMLAKDDDSVLNEWITLTASITSPTVCTQEDEFALAWTRSDLDQSLIHSTLHLSPLDLGRHFTKLINSFGFGDPFSYGHIAHGIDWSAWNEAMIVQIEGGFGFQSLELAWRYPGLKFVIQNSSSSTAEYENMFYSTDAGKSFGHRVRFEAQDPRQKQQTYAEVYMMRMVLYHRSDNEIVEILHSILPRMNEDCRIIIVEQIQGRGALSDSASVAEARCLESLIATLCNRELRTVEDWIGLVKRASSRLVIAEVYAPVGSALSIIVVRAESRARVSPYV